MISLPPDFIKIMKYYILSICLILTTIACSNNQKTAKHFELLQATSDSLVYNLACQDSLNRQKLEQFQADILFLENKIDLLEEQISFYSDRLETMLDIISNNTRNINSLQGIESFHNKIPSKQNIQPSSLELYQQARKLYNNNQLEQAKSKFNDFLVAFPEDDLTINCKYWLAEIDYDQQKYTQALEKFKFLSQTKIDHEKVYDSLFKIAVINKNLGNYELALNQAEKLASKYPQYIRIDKVKSFIKDLNK